MINQDYILFMIGRAFPFYRPLIHMREQKIYNDVYMQAWIKLTPAPAAGGRRQMDAEA
jgi:hypothetical protein